VGQFLYYVPGTGYPTKERLIELGLDRTLGLEGNEQREVGTGPDGAAGCVLKPQDVKAGETNGKKQRCLFDPKTQRWEEWTGYWIGIDDTHRPTPDSLARTRQVFGYVIELGDKSKWVVPILRVVEGEEPYLPYVQRLSPSGELERRIHPEFESLCKLGERIYWNWMNDLGWIEEGDPPAAPFTDAEYLRVAVDALSVNYRLGIPESNLLGLFTGARMGAYDNLRAIHAALIDARTILEVNSEIGKKNSQRETTDSKSDIPVSEALDAGNAD